MIFGQVIEHPSDKNAGILKQYSGGIPVAFQR